MNDIFNELSLSNYWNGKFPEGGFARRTYTNRIFGYIGNKLVKLLVGQRGAGKSYLLRQIVGHLLDEGVSARNVLYIDRSFTDSGFVTDCEGLDSLLSLYRERLHPVGKIYIFVEEIQNIAGWESFVGSHAQDYVSSCELFISGSNRSMIPCDADGIPDRHYVSFEVFPLSYSEYVERESEEVSDASYTSYMESGGLPRLSACRSEEERRGYVASLKDTVLFRDVVKRYRVKDPRLLEDTLVYLADHLSDLVSVTGLVSHFTAQQQRKTSYDTIANYIGYLEDAFLLHRVERCQVRGKEVMSGTCRYYVNDWGLMRHLYPFFICGQEARFRNHVCLELKHAGYAVHVGMHRAKVIDFMARKDDRIIYIQCALALGDESLMQPLYASLESIQDNYEKWVVTLDRTVRPSKEGIRHIQAWRLREVL